MGMACFFFFFIWHLGENVPEYRNIEKFILIWDLIKSKFLISVKLNSEIPNSIQTKDKIFF